MKQLCEVLGISKQALYKRKQKEFFTEQQDSVIINLVNQQRRIMPRIGTRKLYHMLKPQFDNLTIKIGRDTFFHVLRKNGMLVKRRKSFHRTTNSNHYFTKHPNRIKGIPITKPEQVWVSDITYIKCVEGHYFLSLVTDLYSKRIMGYNLSDNMKAENAIDALKMAIRNRSFPDRELIHHSDRGFQYCCHDYINTSVKHKIKTSMTQSYDPYENAVAERVNGILKDEFSIGDGFITFSQAQREIKYAIETYNSKRPHLSCNFLTPISAHKFGNYKLKTWSRLSTNKHILTKEKRSKKENLITNNVTFN